jgi:hypothetical protein
MMMACKPPRQETLGLAAAGAQAIRDAEIPVAAQSSCTSLNETSMATRVREMYAADIALWESLQ